MSVYVYMCIYMYIYNRERESYLNPLEIQNSQRFRNKISGNRFEKIHDAMCMVFALHPFLPPPLSRALSSGPPKYF